MKTRKSLVALTVLASACAGSVHAQLKGAFSTRHVIYLHGRIVQTEHVLAIRETSDDFTRGCKNWKPGAADRTRVVAQEIGLNTGLGHSFPYRPTTEWTKPVLERIEKD